MFRFTIRDLLWLMVVAGVLVAWFSDHRRLSSAVALLDWKVESLTSYLRDDGTSVRVTEEGLLVVEDAWDDGRSALYPARKR
jgi:hypothetical protein